MTQLLPIIAVIPPAERLHQGGQFAMPLGRISVCLKCGGETLGNTPLLEPCTVSSVVRGAVVPGLSAVAVVTPRDRRDFVAIAAAVTVHDLAFAAVMATSEAEVRRVELIGLLKLGPRRIHTEPATLPTPTRPTRPLWRWVEQARGRLDIHDPTLARDAAQRAENRVEGELAARQRRRDARIERAAEQRRNGRYVPSFLT